MSGPTGQTEAWLSDFGRSYTDRNPKNIDEMDQTYRREFGVSRSQLNSEFIHSLDRSIRILEVGSNVGAQLDGLARMGFTDLTGVELQAYAIERAEALLPAAHFIEGSALDLPFEDGAFDLVFTSGVLIHISPDNLDTVLGEIHRCSSRFIWRFEYFADQLTAVPYRGQDNLMWKGDYRGRYLQLFSDLSPVSDRFVNYLEGGNVDRMYLLRKQ